MVRVIVLLAWGIVLMSCASTTTNLQRETARNIGDLHPDHVTVSNIQRGVTSVSWDADTPKGAYSCSADDMVRRPHCVKK
jgi:hypothetical protein